MYLFFIDCFLNGELCEENEICINGQCQVNDLDILDQDQVRHYKRLEQEVFNKYDSSDADKEIVRHKYSYEPVNDGVDYYLEDVVPDIFEDLPKQNDKFPMRIDADEAYVDDRDDSENSLSEKDAKELANEIAEAIVDQMAEYDAEEQADKLEGIIE